MASTDKEKALRDLQQGEALKTVRERYGIKRNTLNAWVSRWRKAGALPPLGGEVVRLPSTKTKREKLEESHERFRTARISSRARATPPVDRIALRRIARQLIRKLDTGLMCPTCDG